jgi:hypothetical protein
MNRNVIVGLVLFVMLLIPVKIWELRDVATKEYGEAMANGDLEKAGRRAAEAKKATDWLRAMGFDRLF